MAAWAISAAAGYRRVIGRSFVSAPACGAASSIRGRVASIFGCATASIVRSRIASGSRFTSATASVVRSGVTGGCTFACALASTKRSGIGRCGAFTGACCTAGVIASSGCPASAKGSRGVKAGSGTFTCSPACIIRGGVASSCTLASASCERSGKASSCASASTGCKRSSKACSCTLASTVICIKRSGGSTASAGCP